MTDLESTQLIQDILGKALEGKARPFITILYWSEFIYYYRLAISTKVVIKTLKQAAKNLFKSYCQDVAIGVSDVTKLLAYEQLLDIIDFYETDLSTIQDMLVDYDDYIANLGNFIRALFGERRQQ